MKILVFSDSHGSPSYIRTALRQHGGQADALLFLGDGVLDAVTVFSEYPDILSYTVRGNCDSPLRLAAGGIDAPEEEVITLGGLRFLILHGHTAGVKSGYGQMLLLAQKHGVDGILFGHTHVPDLGADGPRLILNPGSLSRPRGGSAESCALILLAGRDLAVRFVNADNAAISR